MAGRLRVALDVTSRFDPRTGVGALTGELLARLATRSDIELHAYAVTWRGRGRLPEMVPAGVTVGRGPMAAQPLRQLWRRIDHPPIEWWTGRVDVVHGPNFVVPPTRQAAQIMTVHDLTTVRFPELCTRDTRAYPGLIHRALRRGAWVHAVSAFVAAEVIEHFGADPERVVVVANGVDPTVTSGDAAAGHRLAGGERYVLAVGTVEPRKNLPVLVRAFDAVAAGDPELRLVVAGPDGWGADAMAAAIASSAVRDRIARLGWVSDADRADLLAGATAFAYPSRYEGFGLPPLEAMAAGVPVVTTTAGALPETTGDAALLVAPDDATVLADALTTLLGDEGHRRRLIAAGHRNIARFSWADTAEAMVALYRRAAGN